MKVCGYPGCENPLTGAQTRWCSAECLRAGTLAGRRAKSRGVLGQPRRDYGIKPGDSFGKATFVVEVPYELPGRRPVRGAWLTCSSCSAEFTARLSDVAAGKIRNCRGCREYRRK